jgi:hypothetical protein
VVWNTANEAFQLLYSYMPPDAGDLGGDNERSREEEWIVSAMSQASKSCAESRVLHGVGMSIEDHLCGANFDDTHTLPFEEMARTTASILQARPRSGGTDLG